MISFVVPKEDYKEYGRLIKSVKDLVKVFVKGEELSELETVIELEYLTQKYDKVMDKKKYQKENDKIKLTDYDCLKLCCRSKISIDFSKIKLDGYKSRIEDIFHVYK